MRLGLLGGTFDPIHRGHLEAARTARQRLALGTVLFVPCHVPPHRSRGPHASGHHRFAMTAIAVLDEPGFAVSDLELARPGPSYSIETLGLLHGQGWRPSQLFFITGVDAFADIATWRGYPAVLDASHFVVVTRPGYSRDELRARLPEQASRFIELADTAAGSEVLDGPRTAILLLDAATSDVSSTEVRRRLDRRLPLTGLVPEPVERYIHQHHLYESALAAPQLHGQV